MLDEPSLGRLRERLQRSAATALGLLLIILVFVYLVPRRDEIAAGLQRSRDAAALAAETAPRASEPEPVAETTPPPQDSAPTVAPASDPAPAAPDTASPAPTATAALTPSELRPGDTPEESRSQLLARPVALDTATILVGRGKVTLAGIAPVPLTRRCGESRESWFCGVEARTQFRAWLRARSIRCDVPAGFGERTEAAVSTCDLAGEDLGHWLVANGWAEATENGPYAGLEKDAKAQKLGIWAAGRTVR
ncbi:hypothetical protein GCM10011390_11880 [Aureimonas endophytica]|uniref:Endonuclease YncB(Thermonuclease family) n=1 Tax=Aureimonas endophytica TaxID=2027858 RepID=A0A917E2V2_9HYPH|nr:thermonuclease family protein [Aureimonas endophytica]GGD94730.1 hypothetical protein GCM10011390_11880 [Aureimonas endophytica]